MTMNCQRQNMMITMMTGLCLSLMVVCDASYYGYDIPDGDTAVRDYGGHPVKAGVPYDVFVYRFSKRRQRGVLGVDNRTCPPSVIEHEYPSAGQGVFSLSVHPLKRTRDGIVHFDTPVYIKLEKSTIDGPPGCPAANESRFWKVGEYQDMNDNNKTTNTVVTAGAQEGNMQATVFMLHRVKYSPLTYFITACPGGGNNKCKPVIPFQDSPKLDEGGDFYLTLGREDRTDFYRSGGPFDFLFFKTS